MNVPTCRLSPGERVGCFVNEIWSIFSFMFSRHESKAWAQWNWSGLLYGWPFTRPDIGKMAIHGIRGVPIPVWLVGPLLQKTGWYMQLTVYTLQLITGSLDLRFRAVIDRLNSLGTILLSLISVGVGCLQPWKVTHILCRRKSFINILCVWSQLCTKLSRHRADRNDAIRLSLLLTSNKREV